MTRPSDQRTALVLGTILAASGALLLFAMAGEFLTSFLGSRLAGFVLAVTLMVFGALILLRTGQPRAEP